MGYSHYWTTKQSTENSAWDAFTVTVKQLIDETLVTIKGGDGTGEATITDKLVMFNGDREKDEDFETFAIERDSGTWDFCKTGHRPYDGVVVASLMVAENYGILTWNSDGVDDEFDEALQLLDQISFVK